MFANAGGEGPDDLFIAARYGDQDAFDRWMGILEIPLRRALSRFARYVDVEVVVQETFLRMWILARDPAWNLKGENASVRYAFVVARNVACEELRRWWRLQPVDVSELEILPQGKVNPPIPDPPLYEKIQDCIGSLRPQYQNALRARIDEGHLPDSLLADRLRMRLNTFLQNIVRARAFVKKCLERKGIRLEEVMP